MIAARAWIPARRTTDKDIDVARSVSGLADSIAVPAEAIGAAATDMICEILANGTKPAVRLLPPALTGSITAP